MEMMEERNIPVCVIEVEMYVFINKLLIIITISRGHIIKKINSWKFSYL